MGMGYISQVQNFEFAKWVVLLGHADQIWEVALAWANPSTRWFIDKGLVLGKFHGLPEE